MELWRGVPANWMVLAVGVVVDWALAEKVANAIKTTRQNKTAAEFPLKTDLLRANEARIPEGLTCWPSCPGNLGSRIFNGVQEGIIQTAGAANLQHPFASGSAANCASQTKESDQPGLQIYGSAIYKPIFFDAEKAGQRVDPLI
jgi:hypothetical protein